MRIIRISERSSLPETIEKISEAHRGKKHTEETRRKLSEANEGKKLSEETRRKMSESKKGNKNCLGRKLSEEHKKKLSLTHSKPIGTKKTAGGGYIQIKTENGWEMEHRVVMEKDIGRKLLPEETVHHRDGVRSNNALENLELWTRNHPIGVRFEDYKQSVIHFINTYGIPEEVFAIAKKQALCSIQGENHDQRN